ncbi:NTP transferase domain-containing protein [Candidatus Woesebacteria bacterium]|nr:NTP transferase domain-containing protein [Candidatus Woesebacteria bacterium]
MIKKALITCAGFGTRFLPITKTIQKEMLPILNKPIIDYVVDDCIEAGIEEIIFVVKESESKLVESYYTEYRSLKQHLEKMGKLEMYKDVLSRHEKTKFTFVTQTIADKYGTAIPVQLAKEHLKDEEAFLVFMGDDFIFNPDGKNETKQMIEMFSRSQANALVTCIKKPDEELYKYGIAQIKQENGFNYLKNLVEKPAVGTAPSNLANISQYIFTPEIFDIIEKQGPNEQSGEYYITDSATILAKDKKVCIYTPSGRYLDGGNILGWLKANIIVAKDNPEIKDDLQNFIKEEFKY